MWNPILEGAKQEDLNISNDDEPTITVDRLDLAQFIHLMVDNQRLRNVIDTITSKVILLLGRFTPERKRVLEALRTELRSRNYVPVLFDFDKPLSRDITETVSILAHMARFVIADITDPRSMPQELMRIIPDLPSVPVQPLILTSETEYGMFEHFKRYPWVLQPYCYRDEEQLITDLADILKPAEVAAHRNRNRFKRSEIVRGTALGS